MPDPVRIADGIVHALSMAWFVWLVGVTVARWIRRGRIESYSRLMPESVERWLSGESRDGAGDRGPAGLVVTRSAWVVMSLWLVWLLAMFAWPIR